MATITAAAGGGNWTAGTTWVGGVAPTSADDAILDGSSGNVTINSGATARSLDCTGYSGTLTHTAAAALTLGDAVAGIGNSALRLAAGMTYTLGNTITSAITFVSTSATQQTVTTAGKPMGSMTFSGAGGSWILQDSLTATAGIIAITAGTFNTNSQSITAASFYFGMGGSTARTITLGASAISLSMSTGNGLWSGDSNSGLTLTANTAIVTFTGVSGAANTAINTQGLSLIYANTCNSGFINNGGTYKDVTFASGAVKTAVLALTNNVTITGTLTLTGNSAINRILMYSNIFGTARTVNAAAISLTNVDFQDINATGVTFTGTSLGDCGGCTNITFTPSATQTWAGTAGGNWSTNAWTTRVPLPQDDVVVTGALIASSTIAMDMPRSGRSIDFTGTTGGLIINPNTATTIFGSLNLTNVATMGASAATWTFGGRGSYTVTTAGLSFNKSIAFNAPGGTYTLQDGFTTTGVLNVTGGTLNTNNQTLTIDSININTLGTTMNFTSSIVNLTGTAAQSLIMRTNSGAMIMASATFNIVNPSVNLRLIAMSGVSSFTAIINYTIAGSTGALALGGPFTIGTLNFSDASNARTLLIQASTAITCVAAFNVSGAMGRVITLAACNASGVQIAGTAATVSKPFGVVNADYLSIQDSTATGGASWYAGNNSTNISNNTGWFFTAYSPSKFMEFI